MVHVDLYSQTVRMINGEFEDLQEIAVAGFRWGTALLQTFKVGFTDKNGLIAGVAKGSSAYRAGLRNGMEHIQSKYMIGDRQTPAEVTVQVDGEEKRITYKTVGDLMIPELIDTVKKS